MSVRLEEAIESIQDEAAPRFILVWILLLILVLRPQGLFARTSAAPARPGG